MLPSPLIIPALPLELPALLLFGGIGAGFSGLVSTYVPALSPCQSFWTAVCLTSCACGASVLCRLALAKVAAGVGAYLVVNPLETILGV